LVLVCAVTVIGRAVTLFPLPVVLIYAVLLAEIVVVMEPQVVKMLLSLLSPIKHRLKTFSARSTVRKSEFRSGSALLVPTSSSG